MFCVVSGGGWQVKAGLPVAPNNVQLAHIATE